jgi:hypothetical protein
MQHTNTTKDTFSPQTHTVNFVEHENEIGTDQQMLSDEWHIFEDGDNNETHLRSGSRIIDLDSSSPCLHASVWTLEKASRGGDGVKRKTRRLVRSAWLESRRA